jgi:hypothetical protein
MPGQVVGAGTEVEGAVEEEDSVGAVVNPLAKSKLD